MSEAKKIQGNSRQTRAYLCLRSNTGDRVGLIQQAMQLLKDIPRIKVIECSSFYETEPIERSDDHWFVTAVAAIDTDLNSEELFDICRDIENRLNQLYSLEQQDDRNIINLEILFFGQEILDTEHLKLPYPNVSERAYTLVPLLEIAPDWLHPSLHKSVAQLYEDLPNPELVYLYGTRDTDSELD